MQAGTPDFVKKYLPIAIDGFYRDQKSHKLVECGGDAMMGCGSTIQGGGYLGLEQFVSYDPNDNDSIDACIKHMEDAIKDAVSNGVPAGKESLVSSDWGGRTSAFGTALSKMPQQFVLNFQTRKIKDAFDPQLSRRPELPVDSAEGWGQMADAKKVSGVKRQRISSAYQRQTKGTHVCHQRRNYRPHSRTATCFEDPTNTDIDAISGERPKKLRYGVNGGLESSPQTARKYMPCYDPLHRRRHRPGAPMHRGGSGRVYPGGGRKPFPKWRDTPVTSSASRCCSDMKALARRAPR